MDPEVGEDLRARAVVARIGRQAQLEVGVDGVAALVLQRVRAQLVQQADAATLVPLDVQDDAAALLGDAPQRGVQLRAAVAAERAEHVAGQALGVHADEDVRAVADLARDERDVLGVVDLAAVAEGGEVAELGGQPGLRRPA